MADLLTHYVSARLPGGFIGHPGTRTTFILGVFLPDLAGKAIENIPGMPDGLAVPSHSLAGLICLSYLVSMFFTEEFRRRAFTTLFLGSMIHVGLDCLKDSLGSGATYFLHPFSLKGFELGLYFNENILWFLPGNLFLLLLIRWATKRAQKMGLRWN